MKKVKNYKLKKRTKFLKPCIKLAETIIKFGDIKIKIQISHQYKRPISIDNMDVKQQFLRRSLLTSIDLNISWLQGYYKNWNFTHISSKKECILKRF